MSLVFQIHSIILWNLVCQIRQKGNPHWSKSSLFTRSINPLKERTYRCIFHTDLYSLRQSEITNYISMDREIYCKWHFFLFCTLRRRTVLLVWTKCSVDLLQILATSVNDDLLLISHICFRPMCSWNGTMWSIYW